MSFKVVVANAFSASMLGKKGKVCYQEIDQDEAAEMLLSADEVRSTIGHEGTAHVFSQLLRADLPARREFYKLVEQDTLLVGSINIRLPEGKVLSADELAELPVRWLLIHECT